MGTLLQSLDVSGDLILEEKRNHEDLRFSGNVSGIGGWGNRMIREEGWRRNSV